MRLLIPYMARWKAVNWTRYHSLLTAFSELGHDVFILQPPSMKSSETNFQEISTSLPEKHHLFDVHLPKKIWDVKFPVDKLFKKGIYSLRCISEVHRFVEKYNIDFLMLYNLPQYPLFHIHGCYKIFDYADDYVSMLAEELSVKNQFKKFVVSVAESVLSRIVEKADITFSISYVLSSKLNSDAVILPNGVDFRKASQIKKIDIKFPLEAPVVGFLGSFEYFIDLDLILETANKLKDINFLLVGSGREWKRCRARAEELGCRNIVFTGGVPHDLVFSYIAKMDICLNIFKKIPVSHSACPIKLFEYFSQRKPVISTRLDELKYIDNGILYYADSLEELINQIDTILANREEANRRANLGYKLAREKYSWQSIARKFEEELIRFIE